MEQNLKELRKEKGLHLNFICKQLGISSTHFYRIENGQGYLTKERIKKLAKIYNVRIVDIKQCFGRSNK